MIKVLVTGGAGFIGSNLVNELVKKGYEVTVVDDLSMGSISNLTECINKIKFYKKDVCDEKFMHYVLNKNYDYIYHLAAISSVVASVKRPYKTHKVNNESVVKILEYLRVKELHPKKFLYTSSAAVYGNYPELPKKEDGRVEPLTPYAVDKYASERMTLVYGDLYNMSVVAVRFFNVFGPLQNPDSQYSGVLSIITKCLLEDSEFTLYGNGRQTRDFIYVKDIIKALIFIAEHDKSKGVYNIGYGKKISLLEIIQVYENITGKKLKINFEKSRPGDIYDSFADISRLLQLGFTVDYKNGLKKGLEKYWRYSYASKKKK